MAKRSLKVLHVITDLEDGGAEGALYRLCAFDRHNEHIVVSLMGPGKYGSLLMRGGVQVHCLNMPPGNVTIQALIYLWRYLREYRPDAVQTWLYHADLIGGIVGRVAGVHNVIWGIRHGNLAPGTVKRSTIWIARVCASLSNLVPANIVCCSEQASKTHKRIGYSENKFRVIPNGYDLANMTPDLAERERLRYEFGVPDSVPLFGMVARFDKQKDHENLIAALGVLKRRGITFHCLLVGTGMEKGNATVVDWLARHELTDCVSLLGRRGDIPAIMNAIDVHVLSSLGEAFPNVLAEAMACGTPCVTTDVGDAAYIVGDTGWVVPPKDSSALASGLQSALACLADANAWKSRKKAARQRIETHFTIEKVVGMYDMVWRQHGIEGRTF